jgi:hypothetical protein
MERQIFLSNKQVGRLNKVLLKFEISFAEFEYRLLMDKQSQFPSERITEFIQGYVGNVVLERESAAELVYGIKRGESKQIERLINGLDQQKVAIGINSYGLSMTTIEDVFLR